MLKKILKAVLYASMVVGFVALLVNPGITNDKTYGQSSVLNHNTKVDTMTFYEAGLDDNPGMRIYMAISSAVDDSAVFVNADGTVILSFKPIVQPGGTSNNDTMIVSVGGWGGIELTERSDTSGAGKMPDGTLFWCNDTLKVCIGDSTSAVWNKSSIAN